MKLNNTRFLFIILPVFLINSCGKEVSIDHSGLKKFSQVTEGESLHTFEEALIIKNDKAQIKIEGQVYDISPYSSHMALNFIQGLAPGQEVVIKFRGTVKNTVVVISAIESI